MLRIRHLPALALIALSLGPAAARADITVYDSRAGFLAALVSYGVDDYDALTPGTLGTTLDRTAGAYGYTATNMDDTGGADLFTAIGTPGQAALSTLQSTTVVTFSGFSSGVSAIGGTFYTADGSGKALGDEVMQVVARDSDGTVSRFVFDSAPSTFVGFISTGALQSLSVTAIQDVVNVWPAIDNLTLGGTTAPVPEPDTFGLLLGGMGLMGLLARTRRR